MCDAAVIMMCTVYVRYPSFKQASALAPARKKSMARWFRLFECRWIGKGHTGTCKTSQYSDRLLKIKITVAMGTRMKNNDNRQ